MAVRTVAWWTLLANSHTASSHVLDAISAKALESDDACLTDGGHCALNALQRRLAATGGNEDNTTNSTEGINDTASNQLRDGDADPGPHLEANATDREVMDVDEVVYPDEATLDENVGYVDLPEGFEEKYGAGVAIDKLREIASNGVQAMADTNCKEHPGSRNCALFNVCRHRNFCIVGNYMVVPGWPAPGMESIHLGNAGRYDPLMYRAHQQCGGIHCVLITNPYGHRTQDQLHIHYKGYNPTAGSALKARLEKSICNTGGWRYFSECGAAKAKVFGHFPRVFSEVAMAFGGGSLKNVGITVWQTEKCGGGVKTIVLAASHCSIEHSIIR